MIKKIQKLSTHHISGKKLDISRNKYRRKLSSRMPIPKPKISPFTLYLIHSVKDDLLKPYFSSRTNCLYQSRGKLRTCREIKKQQTTKADLQTPTSVEVFQVPKTHGKISKKMGMKVMKPKISSKFENLLFSKE